jgi:Polyketide synthase modules and related proteins
MTKSDLDHCDPQLRLLLEDVHKSLKDAGEVDYHGKPIGCYVGTFGHERLEMSSKEPQPNGTQTALASSINLMLANGVSNEFNF